MLVCYYGLMKKFENINLMKCRIGTRDNCQNSLLNISLVIFNNL